MPPLENLSRDDAAKLAVLVRRFYASQKRDAQVAASLCRALKTASVEADSFRQLIKQIIHDEKDSNDPLNGSHRERPTCSA
jgi:hypothetical protein